MCRRVSLVSSTSSSSLLSSLSSSSSASSSILQLFRNADWADRLLMLLGIIGSIGDGLMQPLTLYIRGSTINVYGVAGAADTRISADKYGLQLLYVAIGVGAAAFLEGTCWTRTAERQTSVMRKRYLEAVLHQDVCFFDTSSSSNTTYHVVSTLSTDADTIQDAISEKIPNIIANVTAFFLILVVAFVFSWKLTLVALPFSLLFIVPGVVYGRILMKVAMRIGDAYAIAGGIADQAVSSIRTVASYVGERRTMEKFERALEKSSALGIRQGLMKGLVLGSIGVVYVLWAFQSWIAALLVTKEGARGGDVFIAGICVILGGQSIMSALPNIRYLSEAISAAARIHEMIEKLPQLRSNNAKGETIHNPSGEIEFRNVEFTYPSRPDSPILRDLNLHVAAGQTVGLVGGSGSGKSTVISLLQRFYTPNRGSVMFDGHDIGTLQLKWLRSQMGLVSQEPILFATTVKENILFGNPDATIDLVVNAAKVANAHDFISKLPDGYETHVGHFGFQMSGGQKQRIAIARALIRAPKILVLDEATSALDALSEKLVQDALDQAMVGRTTIIVAHRLATLQRADKIFVLDKGKVIESGRHDELMQMNGAYCRMVQLQASSAREVSLSGSPIQTSVASPTRSARFNNREPLLIGSYSERENQANPKLPSPSQLRLLKMNSPEWKRGVIGCVSAIALGIVQNVYSYCLGSVLAVYFLKDNDLIMSQTREYCVIFVALAVVSTAANVLQHYNFAVMGERLTKRVRTKMLEKILSFEIGWFDEDDNSSAAICAKLANEANKVRSLVGDRLSLLFQASVTASLAFGLSLVITWRLAIVMIAAQPLVIGSYYLRKVLMSSMSKKAKKAQIEGSQLASEAVVNHRTIVAFSSQERMLNLYGTALKGPERENIKQSWFAGMCLFISQFVSTACIALAFWYGGRLIGRGLADAKQIFRTYFILMSTGKLIADAGSMTSDLAKGGDAVKSVLEILDRETKIESDDPKGIKPDTSIKGYIEIKNVTFCYPSRPGQTIFSGLNLKINAGETMALVGQSGSGKSTILAFIERFYDPQKGSVEIDGEDIKHYNLRSIRTHIALVSQEPTLFAGTIRDNIAYGTEDFNEADLIKAATLANAHEFVSGMENGYETYCGERGVQLSGGQKQRIALARAILKNPAILLLDEATSALDSVSENLVQEALDKLMTGRTCVVVAHRLSTVQKSDTITMIGNGKVLEQGSHFDLVGKGSDGAYYNLLKLQGHTPN